MVTSKLHDQARFHVDIEGINRPLLILILSLELQCCSVYSLAHAYSGVCRCAEVLKDSLSDDEGEDDCATAASVVGNVSTKRKGTL